LPKREKSLPFTRPIDDFAPVRSECDFLADWNASNPAWSASDIITLSERLRRYHPQVLIIVKKDIAKHVMRASQLAGLGEIPRYVLPFPAMDWQSRFVRELTEVFLEKPVKR
jgi:hypothetical protein